MVNEEPALPISKSILAGKDCDKTNQFLQSLAKAAQSGKDFGPHENKLKRMIEAKKKKQEGDAGEEGDKKQEAPKPKVKEHKK